MKKFFKLLKVIGIMTLLAGILIGGLLGYDKYESNKRKQAELSFATKSVWQWYDESEHIQISYIKELQKSILRKCNISRGYVINVYKNDDYNLSAIVKFVTTCKPNTTIETSKKYGDGKPVILTCNEDGDYLTYSVTWEDKETDFIWEENIDGFKFRVNFNYWDFTKLDQEVTLSKAKENS